MRNISLCLLVVGLLAGSATGYARDDGAPPFIAATELNLGRLLASPPVNESAEGRAELAEVLTLQVTRTPEMAARAQADAVLSLFRFAALFGPAFTPERLPLLAALSARLVATEGTVTRSAKAVWQRPRPHLMSPLVAPLVPRTDSGSYPSGHSTFGTLAAIVLANMVPEQRAEIMARGWEYGRNRVVAGIHFPSDVVAGRIVGTVIAAVLFARPEFLSAFEPARLELRAALGMSE